MPPLTPLHPLRPFLRAISRQMVSFSTSLYRANHAASLSDRASAAAQRVWLLRPFLQMKRSSPLNQQDQGGKSENQLEKKSKENEQGQQNENQNKNNQNTPPNMPPFPQFTARDLIVGAVSWYLISLLLFSDGSVETSYQEFSRDMLIPGYVRSLTVENRSLVRVTLKESGVQKFGPGPHVFHIGSVEAFEHSLARDQRAAGVSDLEMVPVSYVQNASARSALWQLLPTALMVGGIIWLTRRSGPGSGGMFGMGKSRAKKFNLETDVQIKFKDVAGCDEAKQEIMEFVNFLRDPEKYKRLGAKIPRGAVLLGPPGTGKTLLAKATAGEAGVPFYLVSGSEFIEMFVGVGASRVRDLFKTARANAPAIIFVDEIDAIGKLRSKNNVSGANDERETTLNQLLVEMDGFETSDQVVVLAGTNRPDVLDKALLRPGRFDRHIYIDNPELEGRKAIFKVHLAKLKLDNSKSVESIMGKLAALTPGFSGADIANVCNEAALIAARKGDDSVKMSHFEQAIERVIGGLEKKSKVLSPEEKKTVAYHEAGHAICGWFLKYADPLLKVSIIPRGLGTLGYAQYLPADLYLMTVEQLQDKMAMTLGGRVSEELHFDSVTSGGHDDFKKVTRMASAMVMSLGMSPKLGYINYERKSENDLTKPFLEYTGEIIDSEVRRIVAEAHERCKALLQEKSHELELVAQELLQKEVITREGMIRILGERPFAEMGDAFDKYLKEELEKGENKSEVKKDEDSVIESKESEKDHDKDSEKESEKESEKDSEKDHENDSDKKSQKTEDQN